jgi:hypothetical protein
MGRGFLRGRVWVVVVLVAVLGGISGAGCSAVREISDAAQEVEQQAQGVREDLAAAAETGEVGPAAQEYLEAADEKVVAIQGKARKVIRAVPSVRDETPYWAPLLKWGLGAAGVLGLFAMCVYLNVGAVARPVFGMLGALVPSGTKAAAKFDAEAVVEGVVTAEHDRAITARRVSDAAYDAVFVKEKKRAEGVKKGKRNKG